MTPKSRIDDLALFGGPRAFPRPVSTSNLVRPDIDGFLDLLRDGLTPEGSTTLVGRLEHEFAAFHRVQHCIAVSSGFWGLVLAIRALAIPGRREVIMPSLTYRRLADVVAWTRLVPRFTEVDKSSLAMGPAQAAEHINEDTALIIGVHPIVNTCDAAGLESLSQRTGVPLLIDGVESTFESVGGKRVGGFGHAEVFSLHASKLINGFEGGYITTNHSHIAEDLRRMRSPSDHPTVAPHGMAAMLPVAHAAMALQGLRELPIQLEHNRLIYDTYREKLAALPGVRVLEFDESQQVSRKTVVIQLTEAWPFTRDDTVRILNAEGILSRSYYSPPLHRKTTSYPVIRGDLPFTDVAANDRMLMPCGFQVSASDVEHVVSLLFFLRHHAPSIRTRILEVT